MCPPVCLRALSVFLWRVNGYIIYNLVYCKVRYEFHCCIFVSSLDAVYNLPTQSVTVTRCRYIDARKPVAATFCTLLLWQSVTHISRSGKGLGGKIASSVLPIIEKQTSHLPPNVPMDLLSSLSTKSRQFPWPISGVGGQVPRGYFTVALTMGNRYTTLPVTHVVRNISNDFGAFTTSHSWFTMLCMRAGSVLQGGLKFRSAAAKMVAHVAQVE